jgi:hypothetical protein
MGLAMQFAKGPLCASVFARAAPFASAIALAGCVWGAGSLGVAEIEFRDADYPRAKSDLATLEAAARGWPAGRRAEYALYRGLTFGALGDTVRAGRWLEEAEALERARPGSLSREDARRLDTAVEAAGSR